MSLTTSDIYDALAEIFREVFPRASAPPQPDTTSADVPGWDSLGHVSMIGEIEDRFGIEFRPEEYVEFESVGELVTLIEAKLT